MTSNQKCLRILMVEDAENDELLINHELNQGGLTFRAKRVVTQQDFLRELTGNPPDLILSDHGLPSFDGFEALALAQERCPDTPFIFVTSANDATQARTALRCGARAWVLKSNLPGLVPVVQDAARLLDERAQRRLAEQKIREHADQLRLVFSELKGHAIFTLDDHGRVAEWNPGAAALFGFAGEKIIGRHLGSFYRPEDRAIGKPQLDLKAAAAGRHEEEGWRVREDGAQVWVHVALAARRTAAGAADGFVCVVQDLTENRQTEETLRAREESYRALFEQCPDALFVLSQGRIVLANVAAQRLLGAETPAALVGRAMPEFAGDADRAAFGEWLREFEAREESSATAVTEKMVRRADGCAVFTRLTAVRLALRDEPALLLLAHDLTGEELAHDLRAQALAADALHASEERHAAILAASPDAIITAGPDGAIVEWNDKAETIFGCSRATARGRPLGEVLGAAGLTAPDLAELARHFLENAPAEARPDQIVVRRAHGGKSLVELYVAESPAGLPRFYTLYLREPGASAAPGGDRSAAAPARHSNSPLVPLGDPTKIFIEEPRRNGHTEAPHRNGVGQNGTSPHRPAGRRGAHLERAQQATLATAEARRSLGAIVAQSRAPWGEVGLLSRSEVEELERVIRLLEIRLDERELALAAAEAKLVDQSRGLAEAEALLKAREELLAAMQSQAAQGDELAAGTFSTEEIEALRKLKHELGRQAESLTEMRAALQAREEFVERSEAALMEKIQSQQEREIELEQREENLNAGVRRVGGRGGAAASPEPAGAVA